MLVRVVFGFGLIFSFCASGQDNTRAGEEREFEIAPGVKMKFCWCPPGKFLMGSPEDEYGRKQFAFGENQREVTLTKGFWIGKYEVTQEQWESLMGTTVDEQRKEPFYGEVHGKGKNFPMYFVNWHDTQDFLKKLGNRFRLPTEAEWEYACRAGTTGRFYNEDVKLGELGWIGENSGDSAHPVGEKTPNSWGIHDMIGNLTEWVQDGYVDFTQDLLQRKPVTDPKGIDDSEERTYRGSTWGADWESCRSASREGSAPNFRSSLQGFRIVRNAES